MSLTVDIEKTLGAFELKASFETSGGILGLLGASGCGKSMTLKCIAGIEKPDRGRIILDGRTLFDSEKNINLPPQKRRVGYLFQNYALFPNMTVEQNILCGLHWEKDRAQKQKDLKDVLHFLQLEGLEKHKPWQLSGGQAQRVALARILVNRPTLLMLDEPFSALDSYLRDTLQFEMLELLSKFDKDVLLVTHSRDEAYHMCSRIAVMDSGELFDVKNTKELFANPETKRAALLTGCKNISAARKISEHELEAIDWGIRLITNLPLRDGLTAVGIRAHYFNPKTPQNRIAVHFTRQLEEPFEWTLQFRCAGQKAESADLWWRITKDRRPNPLPQELGIAPVNVLPLYD